MIKNLAAILNDRNLNVPIVVLREPELNDKKRWITHSIKEREYTFVQPITFTPYASVKACSARCHFCSENLRELSSKQYSSLLRPKEKYFDQLSEVLSYLRGLPMSYSLSGLEMTDDSDWFIQLLELLVLHRRVSSIDNSVLYSNGAGLVNNDSGVLTIIENFDFNWLEVSRHHFNDSINQKIMRFREGVRISDNSVFTKVVRNLLEFVTVKLICIVQSDGIDSPETALEYLRWAKNLGIKHVIFREFSRLDDNYRKNGTYRYIDSSRYSIADLLNSLLKNRDFMQKIAWSNSTNGYYFNNLIGLFNGIKVTFELSDYELMNSKHDSNRIYKLVFHANGNLCAGWSPDKHILYKSENELPS